MATRMTTRRRPPQRGFRPGSGSVPDLMTLEARLVLAAATHFGLAGSLSGMAGTAESLQVRALDSNNNVDTSYIGTVHFSSTDGQATLPADTTLTSGAGNVSVTLKTAGTQTVTATDATTSSISGSLSGTITPGSAVSFRGLPTSPIPINVQANVLLKVYDAYGNYASNYQGMLAISSSDSAAYLQTSTNINDGTGVFEVTFRTPGLQSITLVDHSSNQTTASLTVLDNIRGRVFLDTNGDGVFDSGDTPLAGRHLALELNGGGSFDTGTAADGTYIFSGEPPGSGLVRPYLDQDTYQHIAVRTTTAADGTVNLAYVPVSTIGGITVSTTPFVSPPTASFEADFVQSLYQNVLDRAGSQAELSYWTGQLTSGVPASSVVSSFVNSREHRVDQVTTYYQNFLGRGLDAGSSTWVDKLLAGDSEFDVVEGILDSTEFQSDHAYSLDMIVYLYRDLLDRQADRSELNYWQGQLDMGRSRADVVAGIVTSAEAIDILLATDYTALLRRGQDPGSDTFRQQLSSGQATPAFVAFEILQSPEYATLVRNGGR